MVNKRQQGLTTDAETETRGSIGSVTVDSAGGCGARFSGCDSTGGGTTTSGSQMALHEGRISERTA